jgi:hypothetical protein
MDTTNRIILLIPSTLGLLLAIFSLHLYLKYRRQPKKVLTVKPETCCFCGREERAKFFCDTCYRRLVFRYAAILSGIFCLPVALIAAFLIHTFTGQDFGDALLPALLVCMITYIAIALSYFLVYGRERVRFYLFGISIDPTGISFTFREEWWRFKLLLKQFMGETKSEGQDETM